MNGGQSLDRGAPRKSACGRPLVASRGLTALLVGVDAGGLEKKAQQVPGRCHLSWPSMVLPVGSGE